MTIQLRIEIPFFEAIWDQLICDVSWLCSEFLGKWSKFDYKQIQCRNDIESY